MSPFHSLLFSLRWPSDWINAGEIGICNQKGIISWACLNWKFSPRILQIWILKGRYYFCLWPDWLVFLSTESLIEVYDNYLFSINPLNNNLPKSGQLRSVVFSAQALLGYRERETPTISYALGIKNAKPQTKSILAMSLAVILKYKPCLFVLFLWPCAINQELFPSVSLSCVCVCSCWETCLI